MITLLIFVGFLTYGTFAVYYDLNELTDGRIGWLRDFTIKSAYEVFWLSTAGIVIEASLFFNRAIRLATAYKTEIGELKRISQNLITLHMQGLPDKIYADVVQVYEN